MPRSGAISGHWKVFQPGRLQTLAEALRQSLVFRGGWLSLLGTEGHWGNAIDPAPPRTQLTAMEELWMWRCLRSHPNPGQGEMLKWELWQNPPLKEQQQHHSEGKSIVKGLQNHDHSSQKCYPTLLLGLPWELAPASQTESWGTVPNFYWVAAANQTPYYMSKLHLPSLTEPISQLRKMELPEVKP